MAVFLFNMEKVIVQSFLNASPERIWRALTNKDEMKNWYFDIPDFKLELHHQFNFYEPGNEKKYHHLCEITEIISERKLQHTWAYPDFSPNKTLVTWEIIAFENGCNLQLSHSGLEKFAHLGEEFSLKNFEEGWEININQSLKDFVEK